MILRKNTHCALCGGTEIKRGHYTPVNSSETLLAVYVCDNYKCNRAEGIILKFEGSLTRFINRPGDLVGAIINIGKDELAEKYNKIEVK